MIESSSGVAYPPHWLPMALGAGIPPAPHRQDPHANHTAARSIPRAYCVGECCVRHPRACSSTNASASDDARERLLRVFQQSSDQLWEKRYAKGGNSGAGSYGKLAVYKAKVLNEFIEENKNEVNSVVEFGCGDGN